jgi:hypothetical protein
MTKEMPWWEIAIRSHCDEHGPSGAAWNISMILECLNRSSQTDPVTEQLANLKAQRDALNAHINLIEGGISKAAYDGNLAWQLSKVNDQRIADGKPPMRMREFLSACDEESDREG